EQRDIPKLEAGPKDSSCAPCTESAGRLLKTGCVEELGGTLWTTRTVLDLIGSDQNQALTCHIQPRKVVRGRRKWIGALRYRNGLTRLDARDARDRPPTERIALPIMRALEEWKFIDVTGDEDLGRIQCG